jgi:dCMP deaminase
MTDKWDQRFLMLAALVASWSKDPSTTVGAVVVRPDRSVASLGFNGFPRAMPDHLAFLQDRDEKYARVIHAEMNAILAAKEPLLGCTMYISLAPCDRCAVHVAQAGIRRVVFPQLPADKAERWGPAIARSISFFEECGVEVTIV